MLIAKRPIVKFLDESTSYPYTSPVDLCGISIINNTGVGFTVTIGTDVDLVIPVPANGSFDDEFTSFKTVTHTGGTNFDIALRGVN